MQRKAIREQNCCERKQDDSINNMFMLYMKERMSKLHDLHHFDDAWKDEGCFEKFRSLVLILDTLEG